MDRQALVALAPLDAVIGTETSLGLRAKNKAEKLQRIRKAARALFVKRGYDDTTMRDIAKRAEVGFGTLFTYASDKRDMLFLIFNDELDNVVASSFARATKEKVFLDQLVSFFSGFYIFFQPQPELSRVVLREMTLYLRGRQAEQFLEIIAQIKKSGIPAVFLENISDDRLIRRIAAGSGRHWNRGT